MDKLTKLSASTSSNTSFSPAQRRSVGLDPTYLANAITSLNLAAHGNAAAELQAAKLSQQLRRWLLPVATSTR